MGEWNRVQENRKAGLCKGGNYRALGINEQFNIAMAKELDKERKSVYHNIDGRRKRNGR